MDGQFGAAGQVLAGKYRLLQELGRGGMGAVWRAEHLTLASPVAIKLLHPWVAHNPDARARFLGEARAAAALRSPHVVQILDFGVHGDAPFIVMEMLEGEPLSARLARQRTLSATETALIIAHVARALAKAHAAGVVHRDLKPENVFLIRNGDEEIAKVLDFGIAKAGADLTGRDSETQTGAVLGTPYYMSPEQARGNKDVDYRSDLWSLAVIAFVCLTGRRPFDSTVLGDLLMKICSDPIPVPSQVAVVPPGFDQWFARATDRDKTRRFQSAEELAASLRTVLTGAPPSQPWSQPPSSTLASQGGYAEPAPTRAAPAATASYSSPSLPHNVPTQQVFGMAATQAPPARGRAAPWILAGALVLFLVAAGGVGLFFVYQGYGSSEEPEAAASAPPSAAAAPPNESAAAAPPSTAASVAKTAHATAKPSPRPNPVAKTAGATPTETTAGGSTDLAKTLADAKKAQADAKKAQTDAEQARKNAEQAKRDALQSLSK